VSKKYTLSTSTRLQRIQNSVAKIALQQLSLYPHGTRFSYFTGFLWILWNGGYSLSWLPLPTILHTGTPSYLSERLHPYVPARTLRSSSSANLYVPRTNRPKYTSNRNYSLGCRGSIITYSTAEHFDGC